MMAFAEWGPVYEAILADFGYDRAADERARDVLADLLSEEPAEIPSFEGNEVAIVGAADCLAEELDRVREADAVIGASVAAARLREHGIAVDCMVTDLDKTPETARALTAEGTPVAVHAHGDNIPALREHVPTFEHSAVLPTTQAEPTGVVRNVGGFTDGDRAAFLADGFGAQRLVFPGWEFDDATVGDEKRKKLVWAERLLWWLEQRRSEQFVVLDGRRDSIETSAFEGI